MNTLMDEDKSSAKRSRINPLEERDFDFIDCNIDNDEKIDDFAEKTRLLRRIYAYQKVGYYGTRIPSMQMSVLELSDELEMLKETAYFNHYTLKCGHHFNLPSLKEHLQKELFCPNCKKFLDLDESYVKDQLISQDDYETLKSLHMCRDLIQTTGMLMNLVQPDLESNIALLAILGCYDRQISDVIKIPDYKEEIPAPTKLLATIFADLITDKLAR